VRDRALARSLALHVNGRLADKAQEDVLYSNLEFGLEFGSGMGLRYRTWGGISS
jgi:hypothetical protein